jgi:CheY-like chemotaxis protein
MTNGRLKGAKGNILVMDEDLSSRETPEALLIGEGYEVRCAASGGMALMFAAEEPPDWPHPGDLHQRPG